jgi:hypothetical protein
MSTDYMLAYGTYPTPDDCRCAMEWVSYLAANRMASPYGMTVQSRTLSRVYAEPALRSCRSAPLNGYDR